MKSIGQDLNLPPRTSSRQITLVRQIIECVVVESKEKIKVVFIGGTEIEMTL